MMNEKIAKYCLRAMLCEVPCEECEIYGQCGTDHCEHDAIRYVLNELEELSRYRDNGWIPCSERLPEIRDRYLCQIERTSYTYMDILYFSKNLEEVDEYDFMGKKCAGFYSYDSEYGHCEYEGVIAWQPLPEPYKPKGE